MSIVIPFFKYLQIRHRFLEIPIERCQCFQKVVRENISATSKIKACANISASIAHTHTHKVAIIITELNWFRLVQKH